MFQVPLSAVPNQTVAFNADGAYWQLHVFQSGQFMCADVTRNGQPIISGVRCFVGQPLMPYPYMYEPNFGNFVFDANPDYTNFGVSCNLFYMSSSEFAQFKELMSLQ